VLKGGLFELDARSDVAVNLIHSEDQVISVDLSMLDRSEVTCMVSD
jgi:hypothetical protein